MNSILWQPRPEQIAGSQMTAFRLFVEEKTGRLFSDYYGLWKWSIENPDEAPVNIRNIRIIHCKSCNFKISSVFRMDKQ